MSSILKSTKLENVIWDMILSEDMQSIVVDLRDLENQKISFVQISLSDLTITPLGSFLDMWNCKLNLFDKKLYIVEFKDPTDLGVQQILVLEGDKFLLHTAQPEIGNKSSVQPFVYEMGTDNHNVVSKFLKKDLPLACEYYEQENFIIICYYLRSGKYFSRHLLIIQDGITVLDEVLDTKIEGFALGGFFVISNSLFFVKNRNEICSYNLDSTKC